MTIIEQIRAEIERRIIKAETAVSNFNEVGDETSAYFLEAVATAYKGILSFLDTLQEPEVDLSEAYQEFCKDYPFPWNSQYVNREYIDELCLSVARHFYELGKNAKQ